jgi:hypothetical protein
MLDDDVARDLALFAGLVWGDDDRAVLAPLIDATIVWAEEEQLDEVAVPIVEALWADGLRADIERAIGQRAERAEALADLALGAARSRLALAYVKQGAVDLSDGALLPGLCLCCAEDGLGAAPRQRHPAIVLRAAVGIVLRAQPDFGEGEPAEERLAGARERLCEIAMLATQSLPNLSAALHEVDIDDLWRAACVERRGGSAAWN